jgi:hypothetical protein
VTVVAAPAAKRGSTVIGRMRDLVAGTPGTMKVFSLASVVVLLVLAALGGVAVSARASALSSARADADQLVRVQTIRTSLVQADANATNSFLVGGLGPPAQRAAYTGAVSAASEAIAQASARSTVDASTLSKVNDQLTQYAGLIESARANNRQGFAVGAAYLEQASGLLRSAVLPALSQLVSGEQTRVQHAYDSSARAVIALWILVGLAAAVLIVAQAWLAVRTRRWINVGLAAASGCVLVGLAGGGAAMLWSQYRADHVRTGAYRATVALAQARIDAFDAKSDESLTLIFRGSGQAYEADFAKLTGDATTQLAAARSVTAGAAGAQERLNAYLAVHRQIRSLDDGGNWDKAVALATGSAPQGANGTFQAFDQASEATLGAQIRATDRGLRGVRGPLAVGEWLVVLAGLAGALAAWLGIAVRIREYQ